MKENYSLKFLLGFERLTWNLQFKPKEDDHFEKNCNYVQFISIMCVSDHARLLCGIVAPLLCDRFQDSPWVAPGDH